MQAAERTAGTAEPSHNPPETTDRRPVGSRGRSAPRERYTGRDRMSDLISGSTQTQLDFRGVDFDKLATKALLKGKRPESSSGAGAFSASHLPAWDGDGHALEQGTGDGADAEARTVPPPKSPSPQQGLKGAVKQAGKVAMDAANRMLGSAVEPKRIEEDLNMEMMLHLKLAFDKADRDKGGGLDLDEFRDAFINSVPGSNREEKWEAVSKLFMKVDADSDGIITWDEFSTFMMLENQGTAKLRETELSLEFVRLEEFPQAPDNDAHKDSIMAIVKIPSQIGLHDKYATVSKDGTMKIWSAKELTLIKTIVEPSHWAIEAKGPRAPHQKAESDAWMTDVKLTPHSNRLLTGSFMRILRLYDTQNFDVVGSQHLEHAPMSLDVFYSDRHRREFVVVGDVGGFVTVFWLEENGSFADKDQQNERVFFSRVTRGNLHLMRRMTREQSRPQTSLTVTEARASGRSGKRSPPRPATRESGKSNRLDTVSSEGKWVTSVLYLDGLDDLVATTMDGGVFLLDFNLQAPLRLKREYSRHSKGVFCSAWSNHFNFLATGGMDRVVLLWTPYNKEPLAALTGHNMTITNLLINDRDAQILSLSTDKMIKVWDIRSHRCLQTIQDTMRYRPEDVISSMYWDVNRRVLLTGTTRLRPWPLRSVISTGASAHAKPVSCVLYNPQFREAVTGDHEGVVCVWDVATGNMRFRFQDAHGGDRITSMAFDTNFRRLITGSDSGELRVWNYSSGSLLRVVCPKTGREITGLVASSGSYSGRFIVSVGWDKRVTFYEDEASAAVQTVAATRFLQGHRSDILALALGPHGMLATGSEDGDVVLWNLESAALKHRLVPPGHGDRKAGERACEAVAFFKTKSMSFVLAAVYADRFLRLWNATSGHLSLEHYTHHREGETVTALAVSADDELIATADSKGFVKTWRVANYNPMKMYNRMQGEGCLERHGHWRAHLQVVTDMVLVERQGALVLMTTSRDCMVSLWTPEGAHVGDFGKDRWSLIDPGTWRRREPQHAADDGPEAEPTPEISAWLMHATARQRQAYVEAEAQGEARAATAALAVDEELVKKKRQKEQAELPAHRIFIVDPSRFDREVNFPFTTGRPQSSFFHLVHITRPAPIPDRPKTSQEKMEEERRTARRMRGRIGTAATQAARKREAAAEALFATTQALVESKSTAVAAKSSIVARLPEILSDRRASTPSYISPLMHALRISNPSGIRQTVQEAVSTREQPLGNAKHKGAAAARVVWTHDATGSKPPAAEWRRGPASAAPG